MLYSASMAKDSRYSETGMRRAIMKKNLSGKIEMVLPIQCNLIKSIILCEVEAAAQWLHLPVYNQELIMEA